LQLENDVAEDEVGRASSATDSFPEPGSDLRVGSQEESQLPLEPRLVDLLLMTETIIKHRVGEAHNPLEKQPRVPSVIDTQLRQSVAEFSHHLLESPSGGRDVDRSRGSCIEGDNLKRRVASETSGERSILSEEARSRREPERRIARRSGTRHSDLERLSQRTGRKAEVRHVEEVARVHADEGDLQSV